MALGVRVWKRPNPVRLTILMASVLIPAAALAVLLHGDRAPDPVPARAVRDAADVAFPFDVRVTPLDPLRPGRRLRARVEVISRRLLDEVTVSVPRPGPVSPVDNPGARLGLLRAGEMRSAVVTITLPPGRDRRTVDFQVRGEIDGLPLVRGASLNLVYEPEPSRIVVAPDGRRIHEVPARRIG